MNNPTIESRPESSFFASNGAAFMWAVDTFGIQPGEIITLAEKIGLTETGLIEILFRSSEQGKSKSEILKELSALEDQKQDTDKESYLKEYSIAYKMQNFIDSIVNNQNMKDISTGFSRLDAILGGGLHKGLFVIGATAGLGKTTFILQIADYIAAHGTDVLFFSLEMAADELIAKSISRITCELAIQGKQPVTLAKSYTQILKGSEFANFSEAERKLFFAAAEQHAKQTEHFFVHERENDMTAAKIETAVAEHIKITGNAPAVFIDYLQRIRPENPRFTDKQNIDAQMDILSSLARKHNIPVVLISALNRDSYKKKAAQSGFKESGKIEYDGDFLSILQLKGIEQTDFDYDKAIARNPREIELAVVKNRGNQTGGKIEYEFMPKYNRYREKQNDNA